MAYAIKWKTNELRAIVLSIKKNMSVLNILDILKQKIQKYTHTRSHIFIYTKRGKTNKKIEMIIIIMIIMMAIIY